MISEMLKQVWKAYRTQMVVAIVAVILGSAFLIGLTSGQVGQILGWHWVDRCMGGQSDYGCWAATLQQDVRTSLENETYDESYLIPKGTEVYYTKPSQAVGFTMILWRNWADRDHAWQQSSVLTINLPQPLPKDPISP